MFAQWFPDSGLIRVHHLSDGSTVADATVEIYESKLEAKSRPAPVACAIAKTDKTGTVLLRHYLKILVVLLAFQVDDKLSQP